MLNSGKWLLGLGLMFVGGQFALAANDVVITTTMNFTQLDGGPLDSDGAADGVFECDSLTVRSTGAIVANNGLVIIQAAGDIMLQNSGAIRGPSVTPQFGPVIILNTAGSLLMSNNALVRAHGRDVAGVILASVQDRVELKNNAKIEANATELGGFGGVIDIFAWGSIRLVNSTNRVTVNGPQGGVIVMRSESNLCPAIYVNSVVNAVGYVDFGGVIVLTAANGSLEVVGEPYRIAAIGGRVDMNGTVVLEGETFVSPDPPLTQPQAIVNEGGFLCAP